MASCESLRWTSFLRNCASSNLSGLRLLLSPTDPGGPGGPEGRRTAEEDEEEDMAEDEGGGRVRKKGVRETGKEN